MTITWRKIEETETFGAYKGIIIQKSDLAILELRITYAATITESTGLKNINIYEWLFENGMDIINEIEDFKVITLCNADVINKKLVGSWKER